MIFQIALDAGLAPDFNEAIGTVAQDASSLGVSMWLVVGVFLLILFIVIGIFWLRYYLRQTRASFELVTLLVSVPKIVSEEDKRAVSKEQTQEGIAAAESLFSSLGGLKPKKGIKAWFLGRSDSMTFEIVADKKLIKFYVTIPPNSREFVEQQISAAYPNAYLEEVEDYNIFSPNGVILGSYLAFKRENAFPFKTYLKLDKDPLNTLTNVLAKIPEDEGAAFQFVLRPIGNSWRERGVSIARLMQQGTKMEDAVAGRKQGGKKGFGLLGEMTGIGSGTTEDNLTQPESHRLSPLEEQVVQGLEEKVSKAGVEVCVRLIVSGKNATVAQSTLSNMLNTFAQYNIYQYGNSWEKSIPRSKKKMVRGFIDRQFDRKHSVIVNAEEMASLWHLPLSSTETPNIHWLGARLGGAPATIPGPDEGDIELGFNTYRGIKTPIWMKSEDRTRHMYIMGKSGSGKSETIAMLALQDIKAGHGVAVVEPHGDLIDRILANIPKDRIDDVIYFSPGDTERPMGLNMLEAPNEAMKDFAVQEMIAIFYKLFSPDMIGPMFEHNMRNIMLTLMNDKDNPGTLAEIPRMFTDEEYAQEWVDKLTDPVVRAFWEKEMAKLTEHTKSEMLGYLISKVGRFVENEMMRNIIGQSKSSFDFRDVMDNQKILLVNLSKGKTGDVNSELLGLIIVSKLQMAALGRADMPEDERKDFYLYIDEFQNFITDSIATILSEARKYRLNLVIAHQYINQLVKDGDTTVKDAVFGNVGTTLVARIGPEDVDTFEQIYSPDFSGYDLINSPKYTWYTKMIVDNSQEKPFTMNINLAPKGDKELAEAIKELSRLKYGRDKAIVQAEILERSQLG